MAVTSTRFYYGLITSASVGGSDVGATGDRVALIRNSETYKLTAGQSRTAYVTGHSKTEYQIQLSLAENSMANLAIALAQPAANVGSAGSYLLATDDAADEVEIIAIVHNENEATKDTITAPKCKIAGDSTVEWDKTAQSFMDVTFDLSMNDNNEAFMIERAAA